MTIYENETVTVRNVDDRIIETRNEPYREVYRAGRGASVEGLDIAALAVAAIMTLGPLFAYAAGLGA